MTEVFNKQEDKVYQQHRMTAKATGTPPRQSNKGKGPNNTRFFFQASDCTPEYFMFVFQNGNRVQRRKAKKMLRRIGVKV
jgi:hypothetical protein